MHQSFDDDDDTSVGFFESTSVARDLYRIQVADGGLAFIVAEVRRRWTEKFPKEKVFTGYFEGANFHLTDDLQHSKLVLIATLDGRRAVLNVTELSTTVPGLVFDQKDQWSTLVNALLEAANASFYRHRN